MITDWGGNVLQNCGWGERIQEFMRGTSATKRIYQILNGRVNWSPMTRQNEEYLYPSSLFVGNKLLLKIQRKIG